MKIDKSQRTTLNVSKAFKEELDKMRLASESYEEILRREIGGYNARLLNVKSPVAFTLHGRYSLHDGMDVSVNWVSLMKCKVGDVWSVRDDSDCVHRETATVIYHDEDVVLVKFKTMDKQGNIRFYDVEVVSYNFMID